jgi:hypothetical protein
MVLRKSGIIGYKNVFTRLLYYVGRDRVVGIATRYKLDGPRIESLWQRDIPHPSRPALGPTQPPVQWVPCFLPGIKRPGRGASQLTPSKHRGKRKCRVIPLLPLAP